MGYRLRKQIIIGIIFILILVLIGTGVYFAWFKQVPTCTDGIKNQGEENVDCGGLCLSCEYRTIKDIEVQLVKFLPLKENRYDLMAKTSNPNSNYGLQKIKYVFKLYGAAGNLLKEQTGSNFILPKQNKYLVEGSVAADGAVARVEFSIEKPDITEWQKLKEGYNLDLYIQDRQFKSSDDLFDAAQASGVIKNNSNFDFNTVYVSVILFNESKEIVGVNKTEAQTIPAGGERYFSVSWPASFGADVKSFDMQVDTNLFSDANFMRQYGEGEPFQQY